MANTNRFSRKYSERDLDRFSSLWMETTDAFDMADEGDFSGIDEVLGEFYNWLISDAPADLEELERNK